MLTSNTVLMMIRAISKCRRAGEALLLTMSVNPLPPLLVSFTGEQHRPAGCGLCRLCCDWPVAQACVISCGTCSSPTPDSAWHSNIALPTHNYITTHEKCHVCLLSLFTVSRQVMLQRKKFLTLSELTGKEKLFTVASQRDRQLWRV